MLLPPLATPASWKAWTSSGLAHAKPMVPPLACVAALERRSRRRTYLACIVVFHLKDHLKEVGEKDVEKRMRKECGIACETDRGHAVAFRAGDDTDRPPGI